MRLALHPCRRFSWVCPVVGMSDKVCSWRPAPLGNAAATSGNIPWLELFFRTHHGARSAAGDVSHRPERGGDFSIVQLLSRMNLRKATGRRTPCPHLEHSPSWPRRLALSGPLVVHRRRSHREHRAPAASYRAAEALPHREERVRLRPAAVPRPEEERARAAGRLRAAELAAALPTEEVQRAAALRAAALRAAARPMKAAELAARRSVESKIPRCAASQRWPNLASIPPQAAPLGLR